MAARRLALGLLLCLAPPPSALAYQERLVLSVQSGTCTLRLEADDEARVLRLRVLPEDASCRVSREAVQAFLEQAFSRTDPPRLEGTYSSLYVGRLVDYPWLSLLLASAAAQDGRWDPKKGKPVGMGINAYVASLLSRREVMAQLESAIQEAGYRIRSVSVEKVLVGDLRRVGPPEARTRAGRVPYDAMVWFRLERTGSR